MLIFTAVLTIFSFVLLGLGLRWLDLVPESFIEPLTKMLSAVVIPAYLFYVAAEPAAENPYQGLLGYTLMTVGLYVVFFTLAKLSRRLIHEEAELHEALLCFPNAVYMGIPVIHSFLGESAMTYHLPLIVLFNILFWTYGVYLLHSETETGALKKLFNPSLIGIVLGLVVNLTGLRLPHFVLNVTRDIGAMATPLAMMSMGMMLARFKLKEVNLRDFLISASLRLLIYPALVYVLVYALGYRGDSLWVPTLVFAMPGAMNLAVIAQSHGGKGQTMTYLVLFTTLASMVTIPLIGWLMGH